MTALLRRGWRKRAGQLKSEVFALYFAYKDPRVSWYAKLLIILIVGYAFSPIDLIPDFIPVLGVVDDLILIPLGVFLVLKIIPSPVMEEARIKAQDLKNKPKNRVAALLIIAFWVGIVYWIFNLVF